MSTTTPTTTPTPGHLTAQQEAEARRLATLRSAIQPIIRYLEDDTIVEIMLNPDGWIWVDQAGKGMWRTDVRMSSDDATRMLRLVASSMGSELNLEHSSLAGKLPFWGARVQAWIPPLTQGPAFALRKPAKLVFTLDDYVSKGILTDTQATALHDAVMQSRNIVVGGGTGSGKTTLLNALLHVVATETTDRVYIIEDNPELQCPAPNKLEILTHAPRYTANDAVMDALRGRPDRIIVGEVRDGAAHEMCKAWATGHRGGLASLHCGSVSGVLDRLCQLIEEVVYPAPRELVASTVDVCVHIKRDRTHAGGRSLTGISRCVGWDKDAGWQLEPLA